MTASEEVFIRRSRQVTINVVGRMDPERDHEDREVLKKGSHRGEAVLFMGLWWVLPEDAIKLYEAGEEA